MRSLPIIVLSSAVIVNHIGISSCMLPNTRDFLANFGESDEQAQPQGSPNLGSTSESSHHENPVPNLPCSGTSHTPDKPHSPRRSHPGRRYHARLSGVSRDQLRFVRLIPNANPNQQFQLQRYTFPRDKPIKLRAERNSLLPVPNVELTVLSASNGDVFAIVEDNRTLRAIYQTTNIHFQKRAKINMNSGTVEDMTAEEIREAPSGRTRPISRNFDIFLIEDSRP